MWPARRARAAAGSGPRSTPAPRDYGGGGGWLVGDPTEFLGGAAELGAVGVVLGAHPEEGGTADERLATRLRL